MDILSYYEYKILNKFIKFYARYTSNSYEFIEPKNERDIVLYVAMDLAKIMYYINKKNINEEGHKYLIRLLCIQRLINSKHILYKIKDNKVSFDFNLISYDAVVKAKMVYRRENMQIISTYTTLIALIISIAFNVVNILI